MRLNSTINAIKKYILILGFLFSFSTVKAQINTTDSLALVALYNATDGANWNNNTNWLTGTADTWFGVTVTNDSVTMLDLTGNNLIGSFPVEIGSFTKIEQIHLALNSISGSIPLEIGNLGTLQVLSINNNQFTGAIPPEIGNLTNLQTLTLEYNQFSGDVPIEFTNLINLTFLRIQGNGLSELPDLSSLPLTTLDIFDNNFTFEDLEPNVGITGINYNPQNPLPAPGPFNLNEGDPLIINISVGGANNLYQWQKNGVDLPGEIADSLIIASVTLLDAASYTLNVTNSVVTGITISSDPITVDLISDYYWVNDGGNWADLTHWSTISGGAPDHINLPDKNDDVFFDINSFSTSSQAVVIPDDSSTVGVVFKNMDWTGVTNNPTFQIRTVTSPWIYNLVYGSLIFDANMIIDFRGAEFYFGSDQNYVIDTKGHYLGDDCWLSINNDFGGNSYDVICDVQSEINPAGVYISKGTMRLNGNNLYEKDSYVWIAGDSSTLDITGSTLDISTFFLNSSTIGATLIDDNATIKVSRLLRSDGLSFNHVILSDSAQVLLYSNTFDILEIAPGANVKFESEIIQNVGEFIVQGTSLLPISISATKLDTAAIINKTSGEVSAGFVSLKDNIATGGATFNAYASTDLGNTSGWNFRNSVVSDSLALVVLYNSTDGANWVNNTNWLTGALNTWYGITLTNDSVTHINLSSNNLIGVLPAEIGNLSALTKLSAAYNTISGSIPPEIGQLANLDTLFMSYNDVAGPIPVELYNLTNLVRWSMSNNQLSGSLAQEIGNLTNLKYLALWNNPLSGDIPTEFWNLTQLENIYLGTSGLGGQISPNIGNFSNLLEFWISDCNLSGSIPPELGNATTMQLLNLSNAQLTGEIPVELNNLANLLTLDLSSNQLSGSLKTGTGIFTNLTYLNLSNNLLSGNLIAPPLSFGNLRTMDFSFNQFTGGVPADYTGLIFLQDLRINNNQLSDLPDLSSLPLISFDVSSNNFTFEDLEPNAAIPDITYSPQADIPSTPPFILNAGDTLNVSLPVGGTANQFQWKLDSTAIVSDTTDNIIINGISGLDLGTYRLDVSNLLVPNLTIYSVPFTVSFDVPSNDCVAADTAVVGNNTTPKAPYWFTYTASQPEILNITTAGVGTVLRTYSDCNATSNLGATNLFLNTDETIKILWDSLSSPAGFNWNLEVKIPQTVLASDSLALVDLYNSTGGPKWPFQNNWLTGWVESWIGVWSDGNGRVAGVSLFQNNLKGTVPASFLNLDQIGEIDFQGNLIENIPDFSQLDSLKTVQLYNNLLEFDDLEPLAGAFDSLVYAPQKLFGNAQHKLLNIGDNIDLMFDTPGTNLSIVWERDFVTLPSDTLNTLSITNFQDSLAGGYNLRATSTLLPDLLLISNRFTLEVDSTTLANTTYFEWVTTGAIAEDIPQNSYGSVWIDYDNDGDEDVYVNHWLGVTTEPNYLYQNNGDGTFTKVTSGAIADIFATRFVSWGDYDNDGLIDMLCHFNFGAQLVLFKNEGAGVFTEIILRDKINGSGAIWADVNSDGNLDIVHSSGFSTEILFGDGTGNFTGAGAFTTQFSDANIQVIDIDNDGDLDISMAGFGTTDNKPYLFINDGTGVFTEEIIKNLTNMLATTWLDIENDGDMDAFIMNRNGAGEGYFMINDGTGALDSIPMQNILGEAFFGRATTAGDINNDGYVDLITYNSNVGTTTLFLNNQNGTFTRVPASEQLFASVGAFSGSSLADYDNDGFLDLMVQDWGQASNELYHNKGNANNWLKLKLVGTYSNTSAIGARVVANAGLLSMTRQVQTMTGFVSQNSMIVHYGLAAETTADITIYWPSGIVQTISAVAANQLLEVIEDCETPTTWYADPDGDGRGDSETILISCVQPDGYVDNSDDLRLAYYWVGNGGNWADITHWSSTSGGAADHSFVPDRNDSVYFDLNSFTTTAQIVDVTDNNDNTGVEFGTMDWSGVTNFPTFQIKAVTSSWLTSRTIGSLIFSQDMILDFHHAEFEFSGADDYVIDTKGLFMGEDSWLAFGYTSIGSILTSDTTNCNVLSDLNNVYIYLNKGNFNSNGNTIKVQKTGHFWIRGDSVKMDVSNSYVEIGRLIKTDTTSTFIDTGATLKIFVFLDADNLSLENVIISDSVEFRNYNYQFDALEILPGAVVTLDSGIVVSVNEFKAVGTSGKPITIQSNIVGAQASISKSSGVVDAFYLNLIDNVATGGATFNAYRSTNNGNNTGWNFLSASVADSVALVAFFDAATGLDWTDNTAWNSGPISSWFGVGIKGANVASIILPSNNLQGFVAPEIATIETLERLDLSGNFLESIPDLTDLPALDTLDVSDNNLDFASLEANASIIEVDYTNQGEIGLPIDTVIYVGKKYKLVAETAGVNNTYQWRKIIAVGDTLDLEGKTTNTLYLDSLNRKTMGTFICDINNTVVTDLTLQTSINKILAGADIIGLVKDTNDQLLDEGIVSLFEVIVGQAFDTTAIFDLVPGEGGVFSFPMAVLADYILLANIDTIAYPETLPTYWPNTIFWEEADTLILNENQSNLEILVSATPPDDPGGEGLIFGTVFEDLPEGGRLTARRRLPKASVSARKKRGVSKEDGSEEDIYDLVAYVTTDEEGNYEMGGLLPGIYRFNVQYPGIPMDTINSNIDIEITDNGAQITTQVIATVTEDGIILETSPLGVYRSTYKRWADVYPVPSTSTLYIKLDQYRRVDVIISIKTVTGKTVLTAIRSLTPDNPAPLELDIAMLESGVYILEIQSTRNVGEEPLRWRQRFVKSDN